MCGVKALRKIMEKTKNYICYLQPVLTFLNNHSQKENNPNLFNLNKPECPVIKIGLHWYNVSS